MAHVSHGAKLYPALVVAALAIGCGDTPPADPAVDQTATTSPVYNQETGRLERLESDQDGDGRIDAVAFMDGTQIKYVEIDTDQNGQPDRWEYYVPNPSGEPGPGSPDGRNLLDRAEERAGPEQPVIRLEVYVGGVLARVEEDTNGDERVDKWEYYENDRLRRLELDLQKKGFPDRRFVYDEGGNMVRLEGDPDGDGVFETIR